MVDVQQLMENAASMSVAIPAVGILVAYGIGIILRRAASDGKAVAEDKSYTSMLDRYKQERDLIKDEKDRIIAQLIETENQRNEAIAQMRSLSVEVNFLTSQVADLKALVEKLTISLEMARSEMQKFAVENAKLVAHVSYLEETRTQSSKSSD